MTGRWWLWLLALTITGVLGLSFSGTGMATDLKSPAVEALAPVQGGLHNLVVALEELLEGARHAGDLARENQQLRREVDRLQAEVLRTQEAAQENQQLRALLNYQRDNPGREYQPASVIAYDPSNLRRSVMINRGREHGVQKGMVVVSDLGLVGKVVEAFPRAARVLLVTDPSSVITAVAQRSRVQGVAAGRADGSLALQYVDRAADLREGDLVLTSGLGGAYPKGLLLGKVSHVEARDQDLFKEVRILPAASASALETVLVLTDFTPVELP
ncbi:MAG: rod shape-determining protein MreC [Chloroflexi bacterium]|nr:rod shape-determining protein MreC [Chloroflexota bacterium]